MHEFEHHIGRWMVEKVDGVTWKGETVKSVTPNEISLVTATEINLKTVANHILYKTRPGTQYFAPTKIDLVSTDIQPNIVLGLPVVVQPIMNIGFKPESNFIEIVENFKPDITTPFAIYAGLVNGQTLLLPPETDLVLKITSAANAIAYKVKIRMLGFYIEI